MQTNSMTIRTFFSTTLLFIIAFSLKAQTIKPAPPEKSDPEAKKVLDRIRKKYEAYKTIEVGFTLTIEPPEQPKEVLKGTMAQEGSKFRLEMPDQMVVNDSKTTWVYLKKSNEVQINDSEPSGSEAGFLTPLELIQQYQKGDYLYAITDKITEGSRVLTQIEFKPKDKKSEYSKLRVSIDEKAGTIHSLKAIQKDATRYTFVITKSNPNKALTGYFTFDPKKYPGVRVEDLRM
ncbi:MAG: outer membrane lipoprotein carrier protein LolA [Saprospiraceae bacterium]|nr:outer membrane lipoprotein carrier protein LolA [Saprospiraceae bacterium]